MRENPVRVLGRVTMGGARKELVGEVLWAVKGCSCSGDVNTEIYDDGGSEKGV